MTKTMTKLAKDKKELIALFDRLLSDCLFNYMNDRSMGRLDATDEEIVGLSIKLANLVMCERKKFLYGGKD